MNLFAVIGLSVAVSCAALFALAFFFGRNRVHLMQALFSLVCVLWGVGGFLAASASSEAGAVVGWKVAHLGGFLIGAVFYHFVCTFSGQGSRRALIAGYLQGITWILLMLIVPSSMIRTRDVFGMHYIEATSLYAFAWSCYFVLVALSYRRLVAFLRQAKGRLRAQAAYVTVGSLFGFVGGTSTFLPAFGIDALYPAGNIGITVYGAIVSYAIFRHRLMDLRVAVGRGLVHLVTAGLLTAALTLAYGLLETLGGLGSVSPLRAALLGAVLALFLLDPVRRGAQWFVDRVLAREARESHEAASRLCHRLSEGGDLCATHRLLADGLIETLDLTGVDLLMRSDDTFRLAHSRRVEAGASGRSAHAQTNASIVGLAEVRQDEPLARMVEQRFVVVRDELADDPGQAGASQASERLRALEAQVAVAVATDGRLEGIVLLSDRRTGDPFSPQDLALLDMVMSQAVMALRHARTYDELEQRVAARAGEIVQANASLELEVAERGRAEQELQKTKAQLERRVEERTQELVEANQRLTREIAEKQSVEEQLRKAKTDWEEAFDQISDAITVHDQDFNIVLSNPAAEALLGVSAEVLRQQKCYRSYHGSNCPPHGCPSCEVLKSGSQTSFEVYESHLDRHLQIKAVPRRSASGELIGCIHVTRDISEQKLAEERQQALQQQLVQSQKLDSIGRLAGGIAHDFNNMLTVIISSAESCLMEQPEDEFLAESLVMIQEAGQRAAELTHQLLLFSRKEAMELRAVDPAQLIARMGKLLGRLLGEDIMLDLRADSPVGRVMADPGQLEQIVMNLAVNARDAMPRGGRLRIEVSREHIMESSTACQGGLSPGDCVCIEVTDTGTGMSEETKERIFEPFFTTKARGAGTGLGLATAYGVVKQHRGHIEVESTIGKGTSFRIYLPHGQGLRMVRTSGIHAVLPTGSETVLVVEDEPAIRRVIEQTLTSLGYESIVVPSAAEALKLDAETVRGVRLLLTDVILPGMNGLELAREFSQRNPTTLVLYMSGYTGDVLTQRGVAAGQLNLMRKPLTPKILARRVREVLDGKTVTDWSTGGTAAGLNRVSGTDS